MLKERWCAQLNTYVYSDNGHRCEKSAFMIRWRQRLLIFLSPPYPCAATIIEQRGYHVT
jgi:hypothetical protein